MFRLAVILCTALLSLADAYSSGAPPSTCDTLTPGHGVTAQNRLSSPIASPYNITVVAGFEVDNNGLVSIRLSGTRAFEGFVIVAEYVDSTTTRHRVGTWNSSNPLVQAACGDSSGMTHTNTDAKYTVNMQWKPPVAPFVGYVSFWGSCVETYNTYWIELFGQTSVRVVPVTTTAATTFPQPNPTQAVSNNIPTSVQTTGDAAPQVTTASSTHGLQPVTAGPDIANLPKVSTTLAIDVPAANAPQPNATSIEPKPTNKFGAHPNDHPQLKKKKVSQVQDQTNEGAVMQVSLLSCAIVWILQLL